MKDHTLVVGDIHGCFEELTLLLKKAHYAPSKHQLIFIGDLINKGPDSLKTLQFAYENRIPSVIGNHELKFIHFVEQGLKPTPTLEQLKRDMGEDLNKWLKYIKSWPAFIEKEDFLVVHAGLVPGEQPGQSKIEHLANIRHWDGEKLCSQETGRPWHDYYTAEKLVIYGHWARQGLLRKKNSLCLDSGCVYGRELTGVFLPSRNLIQVPSLQPKTSI